MSLVVKSSHQLPPVVFQSLLTAITVFFKSVDKGEMSPQSKPTVALELDSQDYGDPTFLEEFVAAQDTSVVFPIGVIVANISTSLYQIIANLFASPKPVSDSLASI